VVVLGGEVIEPDIEVVVGGIGVLIMGLTPRLLSSVAASGMVPPFSVKLVPPDCGDAVPTDTCDEPAGQPVVELNELPIVNPPPSKVPLDPVADPMPELPQLVVGIGLRPPGLISLAPNGMPALYDPPDASNGMSAPYDPPDAPGMPSGDVVPIPDVLIELWASAAPLINKKAATTANARNIGISCVSTSSRMSCT
jgi:hypothetical protein